MVWRVDALQNYIDGKWVDAQDGARFDVFNPVTGEVIATAPRFKAGLPGEEVRLPQPLQLR